MPARRGDQRRPRRRHASCRRARWWRASTAWGTDARRRAPPTRPRRSCASARARTSCGSSSAATRLAWNPRSGDQPGVRLGVGEPDDLARRGQRGGTGAERRSRDHAAEGLARARTRRARARAARGPRRDDRRCSPATSCSWPPTASTRASQTRSSCRARARRSASGSWPSTGSRRVRGAPPRSSHRHVQALSADTAARAPHRAARRRSRGASDARSCGAACECRTAASTPDTMA